MSKHIVIDHFHVTSATRLDNRHRLDQPVHFTCCICKTWTLMYERSAFGKVILDCHIHILDRVCYVIPYSNYKNGSNIEAGGHSKCLELFRLSPPVV